MNISDRNGAHNRGVGFVYDSSGDAVLSFRIESKLHYSSGDTFPINEARAAAAELESSVTSKGKLLLWYSPEINSFEPTSSCALSPVVLPWSL